MTNGESQNLAPEDRLIRLGQIYIHFAYGDPHRWALIVEHHPMDDQPTPDWYVEKVMRTFTVVEEMLQPLAPHRTESEISQAASANWPVYTGSVYWESLKSSVMWVRMLFRTWRSC